MIDTNQLDEAVCDLMEPKPAATKTYKQLEAEDGGSCSCWEIKSPGGWWCIRVDYGDVCREGLYDTVAEWEPVRRPSRHMGTAWKVARRFGLSLVRSEDGWYAVKAADILHGSVRGTDCPTLTVVGTEGQRWQAQRTAALAICLAVAGGKADGN